MLILPREIADAMIEQAQRRAPVEACGYLAGKGEVVMKYYEMRNTDESEEHYSLDPSEQFAVLKKVRNKKMEILAVYHSHPSSLARPSEEDKDLAHDPDIAYVIVSLLTEKSEIKAFSIRKKQVKPIKIKVVENEGL